jgi:hypothetical protein
MPADSVEIDCDIIIFETALAEVCWKGLSKGSFEPLE